MRLIIRSAYFILAIGIVGFFTSASFAQISKDTTHWNDEDIYVGEPTVTNYFAVGGGIVGSYFHPDLTSFNQVIGQPFAGKDVSDKVWMIGGAGFVTVPWVKNLRVGGMGISGHTAQCCIDTTVEGQSVGRTLEYSVGYGALTLDYVLPLHMGHFSIVPGVALGLGSVQIFMQQAANQLSFDVRNQFDAASVYTTHTLTSHFFLYMPQLQFEYAFPKYVTMLRASIGYQGVSMGTWTEDRNVSLGDASSLNNIKGNGLVASVGLFFGLFP